MDRDTPLILAIEPDQRQAARLTRLISRRVTAEIVVADTTQRALTAIGARIPELVLIPQLLSPQDEATLITTFRANAAASHVEILTMPVLTPPEPRASQRRFLSRQKTRREPDISVDDAQSSAIADQIASCLERIKEDREIRGGGSRDEADGGAPFDAASATQSPGEEHEGPPPLTPIGDAAGDSAAKRLDSAHYSFAALLYRLHASTRTAQELR